MRLSEVIANARKREGLSLRELARRVGMQNSHLSELETGKRPNPTWRNMVKIARALNLKLDRLAECD